MTSHFKKAGIIVASFSLLLTAACSAERSSADESSDGEAGGLVGISMPTRSLERWNKDGAQLEEDLADLGYETSLQYAENKVDQQVAQIQNLINKDPKVLIIAPIDGSALDPVLKSAADADISVIAYDRLLEDTEHVDYSVTFDNYEVGKLQAEYIVDALDLEDGEGPYNFEPFAGSPDDPNAAFFFSGAWDVLLPYIESDQLEVPSGKAPEDNEGWPNIGIQAWSSDEAQAEMENRLNSFYADGQPVEAVLAPNDALSLGIQQALKGAGYSADDWPVLTGQDADEANVRAILDGRQGMTVWKDTRVLAERVAQMTDQIVTGEEVEVNDTETYDNGAKVVPTYLLEPEAITEDTVESSLVDSGFYSAEDLGL